MTANALDPRITEQRNPRTAGIDLASPLEIVDLLAAEDRLVPDAVRAEREHIAQAIAIAEGCFRKGGRLFYVGAGTSGRLGVLDASECPPTFGTDPDMVQGIIAGGLPALVRSQEGAEDVTGAGAAAMDERAVGPHDFVIGIAASGTTPYVHAALARAAGRGARTGIVACSPPPPALVRQVDVAIVPFWYLTGADDTVRRSIGARLWVASHIPLADTTSTRTAVLQRIPGAVVLTRPGEEYALPVGR